MLVVARFGGGLGVKIWICIVNNIGVKMVVFGYEVGTARVLREGLNLTLILRSSYAYLMLILCR